MLIGSSILSFSCSDCSNVSREAFLPHQLQQALAQITQNCKVKFQEFCDRVDEKINLRIHNLKAFKCYKKNESLEF